MSIFDKFKRKKPVNEHDEFHEYTADIRDLNKQRDGLLQKITLSQRDQARVAQLQGELSRTERMIEHAQKAIIEIKDREERRKAAAAQR